MTTYTALPLSSKRPNLRTSLLGRLFDRTITGQHLNLQIHQHYGERLHVLWKTNSKDSERCFERHFEWTCDLDWLRKDFSAHPIPGTCTCIVDNPKVLLQCIVCDRPVSMPTRIQLCGWVLRAHQEMDPACKCRCPVTSSEVSESPQRVHRTFRPKRRITHLSQLI